VVIFLFCHHNIFSLENCSLKGEIMGYKKLVRDKIPQIIEKNDGRSCKFRIMDDNEYLNELNKKIQEELTEYLESGDIEELADLEEVLRAILDCKGVSYEEFEKICFFVVVVPFCLDCIRGCFDAE
jgi:predicted house-cleaning noncanonical NTP pyrophosphatase (MazG superfamily)